MSDRAFSEGLDRWLTTEPEEIPLDEENPAVTEAHDAAEAAAEAIRTLNHLTLPANGAPGLEFPSDAYTIIGDLMVMAQRLPQLFGQLSAWLEREDQAGRVGADFGQPPGFRIAETQAALGYADELAGELARHLNDAHNACSGLTGEDHP